MVSRASISTHDPEVALPVLAKFFPKVRMSNPGEEFAFDLESIQDSRVSLHNYHVRSPGSTSAVDTTGSLVVGQLSHGLLSLAAGRDMIDTTEPWIFPDREVVGEWDELTISSMALSLVDAQRFAQALVGDDRFRLEFAGTSPLDRNRSRQWAALVNYTRRSMAEDGTAMELEIVRANAFDYLMAMLLATFPNNTLDSQGNVADSLRLPGAVRRAIQFMDENSSSPISVEQIAEAARLSVRGLQYAFRGTLGTTPLAYLRRERLARAHADLVTGDPTRGATVREIANRWGFVHLGRFAEQYREAYGVTPRRTLDS